ncbi:hypothetical protein PPL_01441 [Heterostelium album PN500]|uniref:Lipase maturation factor 2 n=1 Tax=Heterostelium pallidum (strain ATCC 26659 / Pp 5 / PN500) TaxID=670386 RepID=D3AZA1_HETP5|nr:hypothetical protein PPL_01441 [Heterostelium album PN500]EFA85484.1 hypothetical protein PPL_01441 [Heterostelium album PN500]|eukprot:XP_020437592.1 hypothetical protein PPL_01441 [Heterostelium album PN500]
MLVKLLEGSPEVLSLIEYSPFPVDQPPRYIRALRYKYSFTKWSNTSSEEWWRREYKGIYVRPFSLNPPPPPPPTTQPSTTTTTSKNNHQHPTPSSPSAKSSSSSKKATMK